MGAKPRHELYDVVTLLFALRQSLSLRDYDLQYELMDIIFAEIKKLDPDMYARIEKEQLLEQEQKLRKIHEQLKSRTK